MQKKMGGDGNLYDVDVREEEETYAVITYETTAFKVSFKRLKERDGELKDKDPVVAFLDKLNQRDKYGALKIPEEEHKARKVDFIERRMKRAKSGVSGDEWDQSKKAIYKAVFGEEL